MKKPELFVAAALLAGFALGWVALVECATGFASAILVSHSWLAEQHCLGPQIRRPKNRGGFYVRRTRHEPALTSVTSNETP